MMMSSVFVPGAVAFLVAAPSAAYAQANSSQTDNNIRAALMNNLKNSEFKDVHVSVTNGVVDLEGTVPNFAVKEDADKRAHRIKNVNSVRNMLKISGAGSISDAALQQKLVRAITYDRVGYWGQSPVIRNVTPFNAIGVSVTNGVVTLGGHAYDPISADSAVALASRTPGVDDVINNIKVDPTSPMDDRIRLQAYRAIYGFPSLNKYAINPAQPIRITVDNGKIILNGVVDSTADKNTAGIRANSVPNVFSVVNNLRVESSSNEKP
jgi:osmotically-inducible protein OsmY